MTGKSGVYTRESRYLDRYVQLGVAQGRVLSVEFPRSAEAGDDHELLDRIETYLAGDPDDFGDVTVAMTMPTGERAVLEAVRGIPYGEDASIQQLARMVPGRDPDDGADMTTVREGLAANPAPIFVPTHRVRGGPDGMPASIAERLRSLEGL